MTAAQKNEAARKVIDVKFGRHTYKIRPDDITIDAFEALRADDGYGFVKGVLGDAQFETYKERHPKLVDLQKMSTAIIKAMGNSQASPRGSSSSSTPTARR